MELVEEEDLFQPGAILDRLRGPAKRAHSASNSLDTLIRDVRAASAKAVTSDGHAHLEDTLFQPGALLNCLRTPRVRKMVRTGKTCCERCADDKGSKKIKLSRSV